MPLIRHALRLSVLAVMALALPGLIAACGRKGDIIPPGTVLPEQVKDLHAEPREGMALLAWTMPSTNIDGTPLSDLGGFDVLRARLAGEADECDCEYQRVGVIDLESPDGALIKGGRVVWADPDKSLEYGQRYGYRVRAFNRDEYRGPESNTASFMFLPPPPAPPGLAAVPEDRAVRLTWQGVEDAETGLTGYNVYRTDTAGGPMTSPVNRQPVTQTAYMDSGLANGESYYYRVTSLAGSTPPYSEGPPSGEVEAVPADLIPPETPSGLQAVPSEAGTLMSWLPSMDTDVAGYVLYRKGPDDAEFTPLPGMPAKGITYNDADVEHGRSYSYAVSALDTADPPNESPLSEPVSVAVPSPGTP